MPIWLNIKRGQSNNENSKRVNSIQNQQDKGEDLIVYDDPFVDQYEEEDIVDDSQLNEDEVEEMGMEEEEEERHDVSIYTLSNCFRYLKSAKIN